MARPDGRKDDETRKITITKHFILHPEGSVLMEIGNTKVICNATVEESLPGFRKGSGEGWVTAEYAMLPRATNIRNARDIVRLKQNPRSVEIQRLIGRALRMGINLKALGERTITVDCDVIQADGGTRTASISGGFVAMALACEKLVAQKVLSRSPITGIVSAVSVGIVKGEPLLDLCYAEDALAEVDMNVVMTQDGRFAELQGTGENAPFSREELTVLLDYAWLGNQEVLAAQKEALGMV